MFNPGKSLGLQRTDTAMEWEFFQMMKDDAGGAGWGAPAGSEYELPPLDESARRYADHTRARIPVRVLGIGSFGTATLMSDSTVEKKAFIGDSDSRTAFETEVEALKSLSHPNIVQYIDSYKTVEDYQAYGYLVIEYAPGKTVREWLDDNRTNPVFNLKLKWYPFVQTFLLAISYIHSKNVHHLDLHPGNVVINITSEDKTLKVIDFGLSCNRKKSSTCGAPGQMAFYTPFVSHEKMLNPTLLKPEDMRMMDLYAVGAQAYLWWFGEPPYKREMEMKTRRSNINPMTALDFIANNRLRFPLALEEEDPDNPRAIQAMRKLLCNPHAENTEEYSLKDTLYRLTDDLKTLASPESLWPPQSGP